MTPDLGASGTRLGSYTILGPLGAGGMGAVYRARDARLEREVALKLLPEDLASDSERRSWLLREARAAASLNHPNICTIYEVGEVDGHAYIAMELVEGRPLSAILADGPLASDQVVRYALQLSDALAHAHERGVIHRDFKSGNVLVTPDGRIKVVDFGLAKRVGDHASLEAATESHQSLTMPGAILGTLPYMAPEQLRGQPADARSDVWALGVVLYELCTGSRPFQAATTLELSSAILRDATPPLPTQVPGALQVVTTRCLEKEPGRRYQRVSEAHAALEMASSRTQGATWQPATASGSRRLVAAAGIAALLVVVGTVAWLNRAAIEDGDAPEQIRSLAVLPLENRSGNPSEDYFVEGIHEALIADLARIGLQKVIAKPSADAFKGTNKLLRDIARELGVTGLVTGSVVRASDRVQVTAQLVSAASGAVVWANRYERSAGDVLSLQNDIVSAIAREIRQNLTREQTARLSAAHPVNPAAHDSYLKARSRYATFVNSGMNRTLLQSAIDEFERAIQLDPTYAPPYAALSNMYLNASQSSLVRPNDVFSKARAAALRAVELDDTLADAHAALGDVALWYDWNWDAAEREIRRALDLSPDSTAALRASQNYATLVADRFDEASRASQRILDLDPLNPFSRLQTVWVSFFARRHDESVARAKSLVELWPTNTMGPYFLAANYAVKGMAAETATECEKLMGQVGGAYVMRLIGQCVWALGRVGQADAARRLLQRLEQPPEGVWLDPAVMAQAYAGLGDISHVVEWAQQGIDERSPTMIYLKVSPLFDPVRGDPRFQSLLRQMHYPG